MDMNSNDVTGTFDSGFYRIYLYECVLGMRTERYLAGSAY